MTGTETSTAAGPAKTSPAEHLAQVEASLQGGGDARLREVLRAAVRHVHAFAEEVGLTREEWLTGIEFLTAVGQRCDDQRQEFILLSDTLGLSMLVEMLAQAQQPGATEPTVFGPFHVEGAPWRAFGASIVESDLGGEPLVVRGTVRDLAGAPIEGATLDVWQTAPNGLYDVQDAAHQAAMNLRGRFATGPDGGYEFRTVRPVDYQIPKDGPVGGLLATVGRHAWRPAHIHFVVGAPGFKTVTTHAFDAASQHLDSDAVFGVRPSLVVDMEGGEATFDVVLEPS